MRRVRQVQMFKDPGTKESNPLNILPKKTKKQNKTHSKV